LAIVTESSSFQAENRLLINIWDQRMLREWHVSQRKVEPRLACRWMDGWKKASQHCITLDTVEAKKTPSPPWQLF